MKSKSLLWNKIWTVAKKYKWRLILSYAALLAELAFNQAMPLFLGNVVDSAVYKSDMTMFLNASIFYILIFLGQQSCGFLQLQLWQILNNKYVYSLRILCYEKILKLKAKNLYDVKTGDMIQIINGDTMEFHHIIQRYAMRIVNAGIGTVVSLVIVAYIKWEIAIIITILIPSSILLTKNIKKRMKAVTEKIRDDQGQYNSWLMEILKGLREIKLFAAENTAQNHFIAKNLNLIKSYLKQTKLQLLSDNIISLIYFVALLIFYIISALFVVNKSINIAQYISIAAYYGLISNNFQDILRDNMQFQSRKTSVERVFELLENDYENEAGLNKIDVTDGSIDIINISFSYRKDVKILNNISCSIFPSEKIGIVGKSGVGKSTLAFLLIKYLAPDNGSIIIDGQDITKCTYSSVRKNIGIVSQEVIIFDTSIKENICFDKEVSDDIIWNLLDKVYLKTEVEDMANGIYTVLGKDGMSLSGGQNQRLTIARMLYKNPKIIILDEATSSLDEATEEVVQKALDELSVGRTSIIISHRLKSIINTNKILVLSEGEIVACGTYDELIIENEMFRDLFWTQVKRLAENEIICDVQPRVRNNEV